jgi:hypothetical protein
MKTIHLCTCTSVVTLSPPTIIWLHFVIFNLFNGCYCRVHWRYVTFVACFFSVSTAVLFVWCIVTCSKESQCAQGNNFCSLSVNFESLQSESIHFNPLIRIGLVFMNTVWSALYEHMIGGNICLHVSCTDLLNRFWWHFTVTVSGSVSNEWSSFDKRMWMELSKDYWSTHGPENVCFWLLTCMLRGHSCQAIVVWDYLLYEWHQICCQHMYVTLHQRMFLHTKSVQVILSSKGWNKDLNLCNSNSLWH